MADGEGCGIHEPPEDLGPFLGQHTLDASAGDAWVWRFEAGQITFLAGDDTSQGFLLDAAEPLVYCSSCGQDILEDRGLERSIPLGVFRTK